LEPGASEVLTHGLRDRPLSTAFLASRAAPIITLGLEVLVHEVIAAITTAPWSISSSWPSRDTRVGLLARPVAVPACTGAPLPPAWLGESEAGNDSSTASS
jgi:hypothetical protein